MAGANKGRGEILKPRDRVRWIDSTAPDRKVQIVDEKAADRSPDRDSPSALDFRFRRFRCHSVADSTLTVQV